MLEGYTIHEIDLRLKREKEELISFLGANNLRYEEDIQVAFGIYQDNKLKGCGCAVNSLLKCFALSEDLRGQNALGSLISNLVQDRYLKKIYELMVVTRSKNRNLFKSCGFYELISINGISLLENRKNGLTNYCQDVLKQCSAVNTRSAIVMNANPFTKGHRYLIEEASKQSEELLVFVLADNKTFFNSEIRLKLVREGTKDLNNVKVFSAGNYLISRSTFPTYFLKKEEDSQYLYASLDAFLFASKIAPLLKINKRFVGSEPIDSFTNKYNDVLKDILPQYNISLIEIPRLKNDNEYISASLARKILMEEGVTDELKDLVPLTTYHYLKEHYE